MGRGQQWIERFANMEGFSSELIPEQPLVEISGDCRVLIENHFGVMAYSRNQIQVKVKFGCVCVCGCNLELMRMSKEQLIIRGKIESVTILRR